MTIRAGILGYGNLERDVECAIRHNPDMELKAIFTRRNPDSLSMLTEEARACRAEDVLSIKDQIDVMILCGGSAMDLPGQTSEMAAYFNVINSLDTHANIPRYFEAVDRAAKESSHAGIVFAGWDSGMFFLSRLYADAILSGDGDYTFWDKDVSQSHSDVIRRIKGVKDARQCTIPVEAALTAVRNKKVSKLTTRDRHTKERSVVAEEGADLKATEEAIVTMSNCSADYDTMVYFISQEELVRDHAGISYGGFIIRTGNTGWSGENRHVIECSLKLDSNPEFTAPVIAVYARATYRLNGKGQPDCRTVLGIAPAYLGAADGAEPRKHLL